LSGVESVIGPRLQTAELAPDILEVLEGMTALDVVSARARYADWTGAARPTFVDEDAAQQCGPMAVHAMRHPILLQARRAAI
jgi:dsDNA-specific endonuclease/ATPase MutS2